MFANRARLLVARVGLIAVSGCASSSSASASLSATHASAAAPSAPGYATAPGTRGLIVIGRIMTMDQPAAAEALLIEEDGTVAAVGTQAEVLALASDQVPIIDIGQNVAYPGFIDAHAHWIGERRRRPVRPSRA